jgi:HlyD family secretion protein
MRLGIRTLVLAALVLAVAGGLVFAVLREDPVPVELHVLERGSLVVTVDAEGRARIREVYEVSAPIAGTARRSPVAVGDPVVGRQTVVAVVEPAAPALLDARARREAEGAVHEAEAALRVAEVELVRAEEEATYARTRFERARALMERGAASTTYLEDAAQALSVAEASRDAATSRVEMGRGALERARAALIEPREGTGGGSCCVSLVAPVDGAVLDVAVVSERPVAAGERLVSVGDPADLEVVADLLSSDAVRLPPEAPATVERWGGGPLAARLRRVEPVARTEVSALGIEEQRVDAVFDLLSPPEERGGLAHGYAVFVRAEAWRADDALLLPLAAVFRRDDGWAVFVEADGRARERAVTLGRRGLRMAEALEGVAPGERVVLHPPDDVEDGAAVVPRAALEVGP